jgi:hypothetical protein
MPRRLLAALAVAGAVAVTAVAAVAAVAPAARAQDVEELDVQLFDPLVTRSPVPERELEIEVDYEKSREGRELETEVELSWRFGRALSVSLGVPVVYLSPRDGSDVAGIGDLTLDGKYRVFQSVEHAALAAVGLELGLPTGSERRGLGGSTALTPYLTAGIGLRWIDLIGEVAYTWIVDGTDSGLQSLQVNLAAAYTGWRRVTPLLELNLVTQTRGADRPEEDEPDLVGRTQVYLTPGIVFDLPRRTSLRGGVQIPLTSAKEFDYRIIAIVNWEF